MEGKRPILISGAVDTELDFIIEKLDGKKRMIEKDYNIWEGNMFGYPVVVLKTGVGVINATMSTMICIQEYNPIIVVNQGTAGAHVDEYNRGDLVIAEEVITIGSYKTDIRGIGEGTNPFEWRITDFQHSEKNDFGLCIADKELIEIAQKIIDQYEIGNVFQGRIGSGDVFNREVDRIKWFNKKFGTVCEDMESYAVYFIAKKFGVPVIGFRVISNNEIKNEGYDVSLGLGSQMFAYNFIREYIRKFN